MKFKLQEGEHLNRSPNKPILQILGKGRGTYVLIGNDADGDMACFAMISGQKTLLRLARELRNACIPKAKP